ncbi:MAG: phosphatidate cytidylyltransferase [Deltaproteobacteria bacterium]|nr:phosphatidate cytidylyltransferase [Deltaproteobacteria bacterium]
MNSNTSDKLSIRVISAIIGIAVVLAILIYAGKTGVRILTAAVGIMALIEYFILVFPDPARNIDRLLCTVFGMLMLIDRIFGPLAVSFVVPSFFLMFIFFLFRAKSYAANLHQCLFLMSLSTLGIVYLTFLLPYFSRLYEIKNGLQWSLVALIIPWAYDTGAYFVGRKMGKQKLYLVVSPGKTLEGAVGGALLTFAALAFFRYFFFKNLNLPDLLLLSILGSLFAQIGDLFESLIKRGLGIKDSGRLIPGHGGILDRLDALLFTFPFVYTYARF